MPAGLREEEVSLRWAEPRSDSLLPILIWRRSKGSQPGKHRPSGHKLSLHSWSQNSFHPALEHIVATHGSSSNPCRESTLALQRLGSRGRTKPCSPSLSPGPASLPPSLQSVAPTPPHTSRLLSHFLSLLPLLTDPARPSLRALSAPQSPLPSEEAACKQEVVRGKKKGCVLKIFCSFGWFVSPKSGLEFSQQSA